MGVAELLWEGEGEAVHAHPLAAVGLLDGEVDVPHGHLGEGDEAPRIGRAPLLDLVVVVGADRLDAVLLFELGVAEGVAGHAADVGEEGVDVDAVGLHGLDALRGDVGADGDFVPGLGVDGAVGHRPVDGADAVGPAEVSVDIPVIGAVVVAAEVRDVVAPLLRHAGGPGVGRLLQVVVGGDDAVLHGLPPFLRKAS